VLGIRDEAGCVLLGDARCVRIIAHRVVPIVPGMQAVLVRPRLDCAEQVILERVLLRVPGQDAGPGVADRVLHQLAGVVVVDLATRGGHGEATWTGVVAEPIDQRRRELLLELVDPCIVGRERVRNGIDLILGVPPSH
jgi:hypothetical protein